jgi:hypothetical protein
MSVVMIRERIMTTISPHLSVEELGTRYRAAWDVIWLLAKGHGKAEVGELLGFSRRWLNRLIARYNAHGPESLSDQRTHNGTEVTILTEEVLGVVSERLAEPPVDGGLWTGPKVATVMAQTLGLKSVHPQRGWDALKGSTGRSKRPRPRHARAATEEECAEFKKKLDGAVAEERASHPGHPVEVWATDEHRVGLKPILRGVWAPGGRRPIAVGHHRFEWLYVTGFLAPSTGEVIWYISTGIDKALFERMLATFAAETGAGKTRRIVLVLDNAGWHAPPDLAVPVLPPYSPELQPAEHLWPLLDEPLVNRNFDTSDLDAILTDRCRTLAGMPDIIRQHANFHWWPTRACRDLIIRSWYEPCAQQLVQHTALRTSAPGRVSRASPVRTGMRNCSRDEGGSFEFGDQEPIPSHCKLLWSKPWW